MRDNRLAPPWNWHHELHQITGAIARHGSKIDKELVKQWIEAMKKITKSMREEIK
jgi:hypothetical protein